MNLLPFYELVEQADGRFLIARDGEELSDAFETAQEAKRQRDVMIDQMGGSKDDRYPYKQWYGACPICRTKRGLSIMRTEGYVVHECGNRSCGYEKRVRPLASNPSRS